MKPAKKLDEVDFDTFFQQYLATALWSSTDESTPEGGEPMDDNYSVDDIADETLAEMETECREFLAMADKYLDGDYSQAGHDFWLTRNGHGAGFWDGDWKEHGDTLTKLSKEFGGVHLYIGDDNKIYQG